MNKAQDKGKDLTALQTSVLVAVIEHHRGKGEHLAIKVNGAAREVPLYGTPGAWFRARSSGERVTLASLYRHGLLTRRAWRGKDGEYSAAYEYAPASVVRDELRKKEQTEKLALGPAPEGTAKLVFKHEDTLDGMVIGPLWYVAADGTTKNVRDSETNNFNGKPYPEWFSLRDAEGYAKHLDLPLVEV